MTGRIRTDVPGATTLFLFPSDTATEEEVGFEPTEPHRCSPTVFKTAAIIQTLPFFLKVGGRKDKFIPPTERLEGFEPSPQGLEGLHTTVKYDSRLRGTEI